MAVTTRSRTSRWRAAGLAMLACVLTVPVVTSNAQAPGSCPVAGNIRRVNAMWTEVRRPAFPAGPAAISAYAVLPWNPDIMYATNGKSVVRTGDGGCVWQDVLTLTTDGGGDVGLSATTTTIKSIVLPEARSHASHVYLTAAQAGEGVGRPYVLHSPTGGRGTFAVRSSGLPAVGAVGELAIAPSNPNALYLALRSVPGLPVGTPAIPGTPVQPRASGALYRSDSGGSSWTRASDGTDFDGAAAIDDIAVDTSNAAVVWTVAGGELRRSADRGATHSYPGTLTQSSQAALSFTAVDVLNRRVVAFDRNGPSGHVSTNGGSSFARRPAPAAVASTAHTDKRDSLIIGSAPGGGTQIYRWNIDGSSARVTPVESATDWDVQADKVYGNIYAFRPDALYKTAVDRTSTPKPFDPNVVGGGVGTVPPPVATISPRTFSATIPAGGKPVSEKFTINLPKTPTALDLYLIIDNSASMRNLISGVQTNLAGVLQDLVKKEKIDVHAGASMYKTTQDPPLYIRLADIQSPNTGAVYDALDSMEADSKGQDEPVLIALHQAATGKGLNKISGLPLSVCDLEPTNSALCGIPPNQNASWRAQSLRVFVHATNERFITNLKDINDSEEPSFEETAKAMRDRKIQHIGIVAGEEARADLTRMSRLTNTLAPTNVDCDGDGRIDVRAGTPLVCSDSGNLSKMMLEVLRAVRDVQPVGIFTRTSSPVFQGMQIPSVGGPLRPQLEFTAVNVKKENQLTYQATFSCAGVAPSLEPYEVKISASLRGQTLRGADATALITCAPLAAGVPPGAPQPNAPGAQPAGPQPQVQPQPLPAQPAPAVPVLQIQPGAQVQVNPQVNPQGGAARQEEKEFQFATATNDVMQEDRDGPQLAMSMLTGVALMGAFATAHAIRRREADRLAYNRR